MRSILETEGYAAITYPAVSERAEVGRATLYRRWPTRRALAFHGISKAVKDAVPIADRGSLDQDLTATLESVGRFLTSPLGRAAMTVALASEPADDLPHRLWPQRATEVRAIFERAMDRGELAPTTDTEAAFAMVSGSLYFRTIVVGEPIDREWIARIIDVLKVGITPRP